MFGGKKKNYCINDGVGNKKGGRLTEGEERDD